MYFNKHSELVNEYNNTIHRLITMKIVGFKANTYINFGVDFNIKKSLHLRLRIVSQMVVS